MGQNSGDSDSSLTVDSAAQAIEGLLSGEPEETQTDDATPEPVEQEKSTEAEASDEDGEETAPAPDEESEDDEVETDEKPETPKTYKTKVDGQDVEVTLDEALKGYSRQEDYTRKTQAHAEKVKAFEAEANAVRAERQRNASQLTELDSALTSLVQEPDWDKLQKENPDQFAQVHAAWQIHEKRLNNIRTERARIEQEMQKDANTQFAAHLAAEKAKLADAIPEWKDAEVSKKEMAALIDYATGNGFTTDELNQVTDHRAIVLLRKARLYDEAQKAKASATKTAQTKIDKVKTASPGSPASNRPKSTEYTRRKAAAQKSGSVHDAAAAIALMLGD
jgi:hypothetical protein